MARKYKRKRRNPYTATNPLSKLPLSKYLSLTLIKSKLHYLFLTREGLKKVGIGFLIFLGLLIILFGYYAKDLPTPSKINSRFTQENTQIFDRNGALLYELHGNENRIVLAWEDIPENVKHATVAIEDKNFYKHNGFDTKRIVSSAVYNITHKQKAQGGSTITQQFIKNAILTDEKTYSRKIKEVILAVMIEQMYSKDDILKMYLNEIPYGSNAYGVQTAAKTYFNKDAKDLTLEEAAVLAAMPQAPTFYSPYGQHREDLLARKDRVLDNMVAQGYIKQEEADAAKKKELAFSGNVYGNITAPHFVMYVKEQLTEKYGEKMATEGGLKVYTSLDLEKQKIAEEAVKKQSEKNGSRYGANNAALVSMDPKTGQILAMVGSRDFFNQDIDGNVNVAIRDRQPGSSFKPFIYATLFKKDTWGPGSTLFDLETDFGGGYKPKNYDKGARGPVSVRTALQGSLNIPAVKALHLSGVKESIDTAKAMGISTLNEPDRYGLSLVLGAGEVKLLDMTGAYGVFANNGVMQEKSWFVKITDSKDKVIDEYKPTSGKKVLDPQISYLVSNVLSDDSARSYIFGANGPLTLKGRPVAAKTGTTDNYKDAWTMGYTPSLATGVWVGNNDGKEMFRGDGSVAAAPIWNEYMSKALAGTAVEQFSKPSGIKTVTLDAVTGRKPTSGTKQTRTDAFPSWFKLQDGIAGGEYKIDKLSGKIATEFCPDEVVETVTANVLTAELPQNDPAYSRWFGPIASWGAANGYSTSAGEKPTEKCDLHTGENLPEIDITSPGDNDNVPSVFTVTMFVNAPAGVKSVTVTVGGRSFVASPMANGNGYTANVETERGNQDLFATVKDNIDQTTKSDTIRVRALQTTTTTKK